MKAIIILFLLLLPLLASADVMNLNEYAPTKLEDSTPTDESKLDMQVSTHFEESETDLVVNRINPRYGLNKYTQLEAMATMLSGGEERGSGQVKAGGLWQLNDPGRYQPQFSIMPFLVIPTGKYDRGVGSDVKLAITSTLKEGSDGKPSVQLHLNVEHIYHPHPMAAERFNQYEIAFGYSHKLSQKTAVVMDYFFEQEKTKGKETNAFEFGVQQELLQGTLLGIGLGTAVGAGPSWSGNLSLVKQF